MSATPIADCWSEIEHASGVVFSDEQHEVLRAMYFAGAMAALYELTGFDPVNGNECLTLDPVALKNLCMELTLAYLDAEETLRGTVN